MMLKGRNIISSVISDHISNVILNAIYVAPVTGDTIYDEDVIDDEYEIPDEVIMGGNR